MRIMALAAALVGPLIIAVVTPAAATTDPGKVEKICAKAEQRYQKVFGRPTAEESVPVILMYKYTFCPVTLTVKRGTTVRWVNVDKRTSHSVWFKQAGKPEMPRLFPEESVEMTFDLPAGEYPYICGPHGESDDMRGTVTVVE